MSMASFTSSVPSLLCQKKTIPVKETWEPEKNFFGGTEHFGSFIFQNYYDNTQVQKLSRVASVYGIPVAGCVFLMIGKLFLDWFSVRVLLDTF